jgi:CRISP-associated protein Cas1
MKVHSIPVEDLGLLVLSHPAISYTHQLLYELLEQNVAVLFCNRQHMPEGLLCHSRIIKLHQARLKMQTEASKPLKKTALAAGGKGENKSAGIVLDQKA